MSIKVKSEGKEESYKFLIVLKNCRPSLGKDFMETFRFKFVNATTVLNYVRDDRLILSLSYCNKICVYFIKN